MNQVKNTYDYRNSHRTESIALAYDEGFRDPSTVTGALWCQEQPMLNRIIEARKDRITRSIDFACGTGRILGLVEKHIDDCTGVDISPEMLKIAKKNVIRAKIVQGDVTQDSDLVKGPFDLVTAFRFFLRAEEALRGDVLTWIRSVISDDGYFVANFHMNPISIRGAIRKVQARIKGKNHRELSIASVEKLLGEHGFEIEELLGYSHLFYRSVPNRGTARIRRRIDGFIEKQKILPQFGSSFIVIARPK